MHNLLIWGKYFLHFRHIPGSVSKLWIILKTLLDWLLVLVLVLFAVEDFDAALLGSWTTGQTAGQKNTCYKIYVQWSKSLLVIIFWGAVTVPPVGGVVSSDVSWSVTAGGRTPEEQTWGLNGVVQNLRSKRFSHKYSKHLDGLSLCSKF